jgi:CheY-like chemotaxis protein
VFRILVVEDEIIVGYAIREELQDLGVHVVVRSDAESALGDLSNSAFDAAIIDVGLPGMRGDVFAVDCRRRYPQMPIVLATGMHEHELCAMLQADPKVEVVEKPHDFSEIRHCLVRLGVSIGTA